MDSGRMKEKKERGKNIFKQFVIFTIYDNHYYSSFRFVFTPHCTHFVWVIF